jgi:predicted NACHT family NTPase
MVGAPLGSTIGSADKPAFQWQRFWVPRTGSIDLSDGGFLADPTHLFASNRTGAQQLAELAGYRALVLLGEPGIGKSTTLAEEAARLGAQAADGSMSIHADLRAYSSESLLHKRVFESAEFMAWTNGDSHLVLHLDSLDEALLRIDSIANLLADELPRHPTARLSIRIACRTAVWPSATLEPALRRIWGESAVGVFELAPLRRSDVVAAAEATGIDAESFFRELYSANVVSFAIKPLTLNLLLGLFKKEGRLPRRVADIYSRGCLTLCEEQNPSRRDARRLGTYTAAQRLRLASRIAAATMFANRYAVWMGPESDGIPDEDVPLSALAGRQEEGDFPSFEVTDQCLRETLDTGLFTSRGSDRMGWAHQGYAEFLAAQYLDAKEVSSPNILKMLLHPSGGLVPQLSIVTAWTASINKEVRRQLMRAEPMVLLQGDLTNLDEAELEELTDSLLIALDENRAHDFSLGIANFYEKLNHPSLPSQLRPYICDASKNVVSRRTAIWIAERCKLRALQSELLGLALDTGADPHLRSRAVAALSTCRDETIPPRLLPLAKGKLGPDPQDEIKGQALEILWPDHVSAQQLFSLISPPAAGYVGAYVMFLTRTLPETLAAEDLPVALNWATSNVTDTSELGDFHLRSLADSIFVRAWKNLDRPGIIDPLLIYVFARLRPHHELFGGAGLREFEGFYADLESDLSRRRRFLLAAARWSLSSADAFHLIRARLLQRADVGWLLSLALGAVGYDSTLDSDALCNMVRQVADIYNPDDFSAIFDAASKWPALWQSFRGVFEGIPLASEDARQLRSTHEMMKRLKEDRPPPLNSRPTEGIVEQLDMFDAGDWRAWWRLNALLTLTPESRSYGSVMDYSISEMPGWHDADATTKQRILHAAFKYLAVADTSISEWLGKNPMPIWPNDFSAFRALLLIREFDEFAYRAIPQETWAKWAPMVVAIPKSSGSDKPKLEDEVVADALAAAPVEFVSAIREIMRRERTRVAETATTQSQPIGTSFSILRQLEGCWANEALKAGVFAELQCDTNSEDQFASILDVLLAVQFVPARELAVTRLKSGLPNSVATAVSLATHCSAETWPDIWKMITEDPSFGQSFFLSIAQHYRFEGSFFAHLSEEQLAEVYVYLEQTFPRDVDPRHTPGQAHWVGPRESLVHLRDGMPQVIARRGTEASVSAMRWIIAKLPTLQWLSFQLLEAQRVMRMKTWCPLSPKELFRLSDSKSRVLVQSAEDLCELLVSALRKFENGLHGAQTPVRNLWDRQAGGKTFQPVEEDALSDNVRLFLLRELVENGIIANREVEVARVPGAPIGRRTDVRIDALRRSDDGSSYDSITAVIESKGCWNRALFGALTDQLFGDYMVTLRAPVGIYLVAWFDKPKWDVKDRRRRQAPDLTLQEAQLRLDGEAAAIPKGYLVRAVVIDCHAP